MIKGFGKPHGLLLSMVSIALGAPMWGDRMTFEQPDGSMVPALAWGDEYYLRVESIDSFTLIRDPATDWICYANLSADSSAYVSTGIHYTGTPRPSAFAGRGFELPSHLAVSEEAAATISDSVYRLLNPPDAPHPNFSSTSVAGRSAASGIRKVVGLTVLVDFSDAPATIPAQNLDDLFNKTGYTGYGNNGSVHDFYADVSSGHLDYSTITYPTYFRASRPKSYYNSASVSFGVRAQELVKEVLDKLDDAGFDFTQLSADGSKNVYAVNVLYAGATPNAWSVGLWPHMGGIYGANHDGMHIGVYELTNIGTSPIIGTLCHENGHMVMGWPDLYDYSYKSKGTWLYDLMSSGFGTNPQPPGAWLRDKAGWDQVVDLKDVPSGTKLMHVANSGTSFRFDNPSNAKEHFYLESRRLNGRSASLPQEGVLIWHVDENGSNNNYQRTAARHYMVSLEQANGKFNLESTRAQAPGDLFYGGYRDMFSASTVPNSNWWNGTASGFRVGSISPISSNMTFVWNGSTTSPWLAAVTPTKAVAGLNVGFVAGTFSTPPSLGAGSFAKTGTMASVGPTLAGAPSTTNYALLMDGYFYAAIEGTYTFSLTSDLMARVWLDANLLADQTSNQAGQTLTFKAVLSKGFHLLRLTYVHGNGAPSLSLTASGPGLSTGAIPAANLFRENSWSVANDPAFPSTYSSGLGYSYYEGIWTKLPSFAGLSPLRTGLTQSINPNGAGIRRAKDFGIVFQGYLKIDTYGAYTFYLASADGSRLTIDGSVVAANDGVHAAKTVSVAKLLYPGLHKVMIEYFQHSNGPSLSLYYAGPGFAARAVPSTAMYNDSANGLAPDEGLHPDDQQVGSIASDASIRSYGSMLDVKLPEDYVGSAKIEVLDGRGRLLSISDASTESGTGETWIKHAGSSNLVFVRIRMSDRTIVKAVPLTY